MARSAHPVVTDPVLFSVVNEFDAGTGEKQVFICRFGPVATMVEPVGFNVRCELAFDLPRVQVMAGYGS